VPGLAAIKMSLTLEMRLTFALLISATSMLQTLPKFNAWRRRRRRGRARGLRCAMRVLMPFAGDGVRVWGWGELVGMEGSVVVMVEEEDLILS
jgi:hypothetical protein